MSLLDMKAPSFIARGMNESPHEAVHMAGPMDHCGKKQPCTHIYDTCHFAIETARASSLHARTVSCTTEKRFDAIADLAARLFNVPISLICIMDGDTVYFKHGRASLPPCSDPGGSFCSCINVPSHASAFVVEDAERDARFACHPAVTEAPGMRFYAGCPLLGQNGDCYGTLCLFDFIPRQFPATWLNILSNLAELAGRELERDRHLQKATMPTASEPVIMVNVHNGAWDLMYCNEAFEKLCGVNATSDGCLWDDFELRDDNCSLTDVVDLVQGGLTGGLQLVPKSRPGICLRVAFCLASTYRLSSKTVVGIPSFVPFEESSLTRKK